MKWSDEQQLVIDTRGKDLLVSAAAGSGKTAVLVERIISMILDEDNAMDIDNILVVTFTNAAAAEMKDRVRIAIEKALLEKPQSSHLRRQATLVHNAQIRTIDSFCSYLVSNYFYRIGVEPGFRIGSKSELNILCDEVLDDLLSEYLRPENEDFRPLADAYTSKNKLDKLKGLIKDLANHGATSPWPNEFYDTCLKLYDFKDVDSFCHSAIALEMFDQAKAVLETVSKDMESASRMFGEDFSSDNGATVKREYDMYCEFAKAKDYSELADKFASLGDDVFKSWSRKKVPDFDMVMPEIKVIRDVCKDQFVELWGGYFKQTPDEICKDALFVKSQLMQLISITKEYQTRVDKIKKLHNVYDFNDIEHMALRILCNPDSKEHEKTDIAKDLARNFREVMVDEYQDSNYLQEAILSAVCADDMGRHDYFMVGDVKQSIYAFRQAKPQIFMDKFSGFILADEPNNMRIDLGRNYRSRKEVLDFCNDICSQLMKPDVGGVDYDDNAALVLGSSLYDGVLGPQYQPEILIMEENKDVMKALGIRSKNHLEAKMVADRIHKLVDSKMQVFDKTSNSFRNVRYSDIVILMRGIKGKSDAFVEVLRENGIPALVESEQGFFDREEVVNLLSLLEVLDNPYNDIPLASVALSPLFDINNSLLAQIRVECPAKYLYQSMKGYLECHKDCAELLDFFELVDELKELSIDTPVHEILQKVLEQRNYLSYVRSLPQGEFKAGNVLKLLDEAVKFESGILVSLSDFVRYINDLKTYDEDPGLAKSMGDNLNAVQIMTIHKSKGLEFPVVFLCSAATQFKSDKTDLLFHDRCGIGLNYYNAKRRVKYSTPISNYIKDQIKVDQYGEEQRVLYVALTRAKEKIIVTGTMAPTKDKSVSEIVEMFKDEPKPLTKDSKLKKNNYLSWILASVSHIKYVPKVITVGDLLLEESGRQLTREVKKNALLESIVEPDLELLSRINESGNFNYVSKSLTGYKNKYSVSELKHQAMEEAYDSNDELEKAPFLEDEFESYIPSFMRMAGEATKDNEPAGAIYGTAIHRFFECFDFERDDYKTSVSEQLETMKSRGEIDSQQYELIKRCRLDHFVNSDLALRMHKASKAGKLYKEQPFVYGAKPEQLFKDAPKTNSDDFILVQGIIDVFFEEDDEIVLMDYKTDKVDTANTLMIRYEKQLRLYEDAISRSYGKPIKETLIYSFGLKETITI